MNAVYSAPKGPAQALFKRLKPFILHLELFWVYAPILNIVDMVNTK
ncbi:hypothetical protein M977_04556 [Buttiauxella gaviniae ATCC 51604]|uniref:Uncharacterized protein n=1 Tax=Buttiauxella gaviniae ATCC 51604 TaxID=1354253 RepID=A0A1B7HLX7_9ENTR|nr:hypothetical protein M977_04556 [Buttiauxella gaviniae ATCC 51604]